MTGARYSVLSQLPYYDAVRFALIDPMHNLLLGTAKHVLNTWIEMGLLGESDLQRLHKRVNLVPKLDVFQARFQRSLKDLLLTSGRTGYVFPLFLH